MQANYVFFLSLVFGWQQKGALSKFYNTKFILVFLYAIRIDRINICFMYFSLVWKEKTRGIFILSEFFFGRLKLIIRIDAHKILTIGSIL